ncbi:MAG: beta-hydroxyacyl-ACP dehydratase [Bacteroidales bacterium]|jgi:3-hydroxyacyl-[acyl-carrier-protein] dehydratase|nr:beta-hydroxyacyl-ACP dehydratase [Bacteroidales bacterium]MDD3281485.1 beta-hydroxyacyl-ACP dehydratase [Bacteroidales bacterium]
MLKDSFYFLIETSSDTENNYMCKIRFNASHEIYQAHFKGNPITPGVCIIQIAKELAEMLNGHSLMITEIKNLKFLNVIIPHEFPEVDFQLTFIRNEENKALSAKVLVFAGEMVFAKFSLLFLINM